MESPRNKKRGYEHGAGVLEDDAIIVGESKKRKLPTLGSIVVEALKVDSLQRFCSSLEPLLRRIVSEEVERALTRLGHARLAERSAPPRIQNPEVKGMQLQFKTRMPPHLFTGGRIEGEQGAAIHVVLIDRATGLVVQEGSSSNAKLNVVVLEGDFNDEPEGDWSEEHFESLEVKEREGKRPLLMGDLQVILKEGVGTLGELSFTDNSSWTRSRKFRLGVKVAAGSCEGVRVHEAKTEAFAVKDHRGELYKKHYPPALHDEVWRLDRIAKDGALHKKLINAEIVTVEDFLRLLVGDPQKLRKILGSGMSNRMWENTVEHAKTCVMGGKVYIYYTDANHNTGVVFNDIYELRGFLTDGQFFSLENLTHKQKISVDSLVKRAYENWNEVVEYDSKVLSSISGTRKGTTSSVFPEAVTENASVRDQHYTSTTQYSQQHTSRCEQRDPQCQVQNICPPVSPLMELPVVRLHQTATQVLDAPQVAFPSVGTDFLSAATPGIGGTNYSGDLFAEEIRLRSTEMLQGDDMQRLLRSFGTGPSFHYSNKDSFTYPYDSRTDCQLRQTCSQRTGKAVVGWLKLKAALRWGIFIRKKAAERRAQLVELDDS
ncbi:calmodulin-binding protein 60 F-like [Syzygium oleosum]|uniref:calmodulin-binding protein 60 F-like n=1 Tax=Syzygium oleosum TaxID=219896 RepID=UPI0024BAAB20|nr:calmodulin-binding protein 60 F-like [Syzygium oleosum]